MRGTRWFFIGPILAILALLASACGSGGGVGKATITVGAVSFPENQIVAEMYAQVLSHAGYNVKTNLTIGQREILQPSMPSKIQVAPEYIGSLLAYLKGTPSGNPGAELAADNKLLAPKGLTMLNYSGANDTNAFVVTKATAQAYNLHTVSDLKPVASRLTLGAPSECPTRSFCLAGLKSVYGITGLKFQPIDPACGPGLTQALAAGAVQVVEMCSTEPEIVSNGWVQLQDNLHLQQADNITPEVSTKILTSQIRDLLNAISAKMTTQNISVLVGEVQNQHQDPAAVAKAFLTQQGLLK